MRQRHYKPRGLGHNGYTTWNPGSIATNGEETKSITVYGATLGDFVLCSLDVDLQELTLTGYVQSADTVECVLTNNTGGNVDLGSATLRVLVIPSPRVG